MERYLFVVDERPYCAWDWDLKHKNQQFLDSVDPQFFRHQAELAAPKGDGPFSQTAALSLRLAYSHALETFFAWAGATFQAPHCPLGWLMRYRPGDVPRVVRKISQGTGLPSRLNVPRTWEGLATAVLEPAGDVSSERKAELAHHFGVLWGRFASDFLDPGFRAEYNALKHGLRASAGGFVLRIGLEHDYGVAPPADELETIGGSEFGTSSFSVEYPLDNKIDFRPRRQMRNWNPTNLFRGLDLLSMSLGNILVYLHAHAGSTPSDAKLHFLADDADYWQPWEHSVGTPSMDMDTVLQPTDIQATTKAEVMASYPSRRDAP